MQYDDDWKPCNNLKNPRWNDIWMPRLDLDRNSKILTPKWLMALVPKETGAY